MKRFLLIANSEYDGNLDNLPEADKSIAEINRLLRSPLYANQHTIFRQNLSAIQIRKNIRKACESSAELQHLVVILIGHGCKLSENGSSELDVEGFPGIHFDKADSRADPDFLNWRGLLEELQRLPIKAVSLVLDCCHTNSIVAEISKLEKSEEHIEVLTAAAPHGKTYTSGAYTWLSKSIITALTEGHARIPNSNISTLESISHAISRVTQSDKKKLGISPVFSTTSRTDLPLVFANCPDNLPKSIRNLLGSLSDHNNDIASGALKKIEELLENEDDKRHRVVILQNLADMWERLRFEKPGISLNIDKRVAAMQQDISQGSSETESEVAEHFVYYTAAAFPWLESHLTKNPKLNHNTNAELLDTFSEALYPIAFAKNVTILTHKLREVEAVKFRSFLSILARKVSGIDSATITIIDCSANGDVKAKYRQIFSDISPGDLSPNIVWQMEENVHFGKIFPASPLYSTIFERHSDRLERVSEKSDYRKLYRTSSKQIIEPNFILLERAGRVELAIIDSEDRVDLLKLQKTTEVPTRARTLEKDEILSLGFETSKEVHPLFQDPSNSINRIFVDAKLFSLYLSLPNIRLKLPSYAYSSETEPVREVSISTFIRSIEQCHPPGKVQFADIAQRKGQSLYARNMISEHPCYSRFAPTPSGSLHLGNLRTAIMSYLVSFPNTEAGHFELRFDDTNIDPLIANVNKKIIISDLEWIGITNIESFSQSDQDRQELYSAVFDLLLDAGFVETRAGETRLKVTELTDVVGSINDLVLGPRISHHLIRTPKRNDELSYTLRWSKTGLFQYKLAGIVDDLLHSSIVVRDVRQLNSHFSYKQSIIAEAIRQALHLTRARGLSRTLARFDREIGSKRPKRSQPLPLFCPPLYMHVGQVVDHKGQTLSKRLGNAVVDCKTVREQGLFLPETFLVWVLLSFGRKFLVKLGVQDKPELVRRVSQLGVENFLSSIRGQFDIWSLAIPAKPIKLRMSDLANIEREVLRQGYPSLLADCVSATSPGKRVGPAVARKFVSALWPERRYFSGASEIIAYFDHLSNIGAFDGKASVPSIDTATSTKRQRRESFPKYRKIAFGDDEGPGIESLVRIMKRFSALGGQEIGSPNEIP